MPRLITWFDSDTNSCGKSSIEDLLPQNDSCVERNPDVSTIFIKFCDANGEGAISLQDLIDLITPSVNNPPIAGFNVDDNNPGAGNTINITSTATDPDGDVVSCSYTITEVPPGNSNPIAGFSVDNNNPTESDTVTVTSTATDPDGDVVTCSYTITEV